MEGRKQIEKKRWGDEPNQRNVINKMKSLNNRNNLSLGVHHCAPFRLFRGFKGANQNNRGHNIFL